MFNQRDIHVKIIVIDRNVDKWIAIHVNRVIRIVWYNE